MIITHLSKTPNVHSSAYIAPNATVCGDVIIGAGCRIMCGACVVAEDKTIELGENCIVMENAVIRSTDNHSTKDWFSLPYRAACSPCRLHARGLRLCRTGASIFHGAKLGYAAEVRINGVVHLLTELPACATVPIGWIAVGNPAQILPPDQHDTIWTVQKPLNFPKFVYGVERTPEGESNMREITSRRSEALGSHKDDIIEARR